MNTFLASALVMMVIIMVIFLYPVRTHHKAHRAQRMVGALMFVPLVNFIALWVFGFTRWPALGNPQAT